ncbi:uncharacterized protein LOC129785935 isoform X2 [Lutzomyia longipalpis]|uniref:uncharacterized protein LOC129785935 isoform X2 n=1 Tax=Lutzomyia longipalpis TaxID=7200 RepID=UPI0024834FEE|nr:uncharacterized protein LOC129785935 isoform X2 [Lutzomyia longipalpis]
MSSTAAETMYDKWNGVENNLIKLRLNKPESWNWQLTTSKSSPNIAFPRIQLYDREGELLADTNEADCTIGNKCRNNRPSPSSSGGREKTRRDSLKIFKTSALPEVIAESKLEDSPSDTQSQQTDTFNELVHRDSLKISHARSKSLQEGKIHHKSKHVYMEEPENFLNSFVNQLERNGINYKIRRRNSYDVNTKLMREDNQLHDDGENSQEDKQGKYGKSISCSDLEKSEMLANCYVPDGVSNISPIHTPERMNYAIVKSKSAITMPLDAKGSGCREKKRYRRTNSVNSLRFSKSILERISEFKRRSSSTDSQEFNEEVEQKDEEEDADEDKPKYFLRTSKAGTLLVCEESFRNRRVRRRARSSSSKSRDMGCGGESTAVEPTKRYSHEKITHTFEYVGSGLNEEPKVSSGPEINSKGRYEREIANIDGLIEKVVAQEREYNLDAKEMKISSALRCEQGNTINGSENQQVGGKLDYGDLGTMRRRRRSRSRRKSAKDDKLCEEQHGNRHRIHRSVSADPTNYRTSIHSHQGEHSSSDENNDRDELHRRSRRSRRKHTKDDVHSSRSGDQLVALNAVAVPGKDQNTPCLLNEPSDQVFLRLVRRLATLQHPQSAVEVNHTKVDNFIPNQNQGGEVKENNTKKLISDTKEICTKYGSELNNNISNESAHPCYEKETRENERRYIGVSGNVASNAREEICAAKLINCGSDSEDTNEEGDSAKVKNRSLFCAEKEPRYPYTMGTNASRQSGKGLSGRRSQSSGNLCNGKHQTPNGTQCSRNGPKVNLRSGVETQNNIQPTTTSNRRCDDNNCSRINSTSTLRSEVHTRNGEDAGGSAEIDHIIGVSIKDRNKFCGSLPNHLDVDDIEPDTNFSNTQNKYVATAGVFKCTSENNGTIDRAEYVTVVPRKQPYPPVQQNSQQSDQQYSGKQSSPYNSSSGKGSITSSSNLGGSTFKANVDNKLDLQLKMPATRVNFDPSCDQGYGSERSPEDELPPPLFTGSEDENFETPRLPSHVTYWSEDGAFKFSNLGYEFITKDCTFSVQIAKGPRGLGLSISGGVESNSAFPGLIRIKRLFPHQAAWATGMLHPGDILLEANGTPLTGLTNYEALEVLRTTPNNILLIVCRPNDEQYRKLSPPTEPPRPPQRTNLFPTTSQPYCEPLSPLQTNFNGEFEIILVKQQGSLGFTLRKEDESVLGHYVRALVREPATTDGRIKPGDKIMAVNDVPLSHMTHEEAVIFLRQAAETVKLRLYRDVAQTPVAALSPTNPENKDISDSLKTKVYLRPEAINLLSDLAHRKQTPCGGDSSGSSMKSSATSPRRLRRCAKSSLSGSQTQSDCGSTHYVVCSQPTSSSVYSDSEASTLSQPSYAINAMHCASGCCNSDTYTIREGESESEVDSSVHPMTLETDMSADERQVANRPNFLNLGAACQGGNTPVVSRKPMFQFTVPSNAYELNNLDNEVLDAPIYHQSIPSSKDNPPGDASQDFTSLPCETFLVACKTESDLRDIVEANFNHRNPIYQSAQLQMNRDEGATSSENTDDGIKQDGTKSLLKWKGVMFSPEGEQKEEETPEADTENGSLVPSNPTDRENLLKGLNRDGYKMITVELHRGWNSRLGFSLQTDKDNKRAVISAIYSDSVAAKDGRLRVGDQIIMVNDELVNTTQTSEIIDLLRIIRGSICIVVQRKEQER